MFQSHKRNKPISKRYRRIDPPLISLACHRTLTLSQLSSYATAKTHSIVTPTQVISDDGEHGTHGTQSSVALPSQSLLMLIKERKKKKRKKKDCYYFFTKSYRLHTWYSIKIPWALAFCKIYE